MGIYKPGASKANPETTVPGATLIYKILLFGNNIKFTEKLKE